MQISKFYSHKNRKILYFLQFMPNLFSIIQKLDQMRYTQIEIELSPPQGIGIAINDRLQRAAAKF